MLSRFGILLISLSLLTPVLVVESADAGVLLRSQTIRSRVRTRTPRVRLGYKSASTWVSVSRRNNPINSATMGSSKALESYERSWERYSRKVKRIEEREERKRKREARKRELKQKRELREARREYQRRLKEQQRRAASQPSASEQQTASQQGFRDGSGTTVTGSREKKETFWSRFWRKMIGG